jgi:hypothetical protein
MHVVMWFCFQKLDDGDSDVILFEWQAFYNETELLFSDLDVHQIGSRNLRRDSKKGKNEISCHETETFPVSPMGTAFSIFLIDKRPFCSTCPAPAISGKLNYRMTLNDNCEDDGNPKCSSELEVTIGLAETGGNNNALYNKIDNK